MPFCPSCRTELEVGHKRCPDCDVPLVDVLAEPDVDPADMVDVYACYDGQQATFAQQLLRDEGVESLVRDRASSAFPTTVGRSAERILAVHPDALEQARDILTRAVQDDVIPSDGRIL